MYGIKKIDISASNVQAFYKKFGNDKNLQPFVNTILEKFIEGRLFELNEDNQEILIDLAGKNNNSCSEIMDLIISNYEWEIGPREKQKIILDVSRVKIKKKKKKVIPQADINTITNY